MDTPTNCPWDAHIKRVIGKGKIQLGNIDVTPRDSRLDARIKRRILMNMIETKLEYEGDMKPLEMIHKTTAEKIFG